jgi:hypothetical protein
MLWYLVCVIQWYCYSSCVKIRCHEKVSGDCNRLRTLVCVYQWSVKCSQESSVYKWSINRVTNPNLVYSHLYMWQYPCLVYEYLPFLSRFFSKYQAVGRGKGSRFLAPTCVFVCLWVCNVFVFGFRLGDWLFYVFVDIRNSPKLSHNTTSWYRHVWTPYVKR